MGEIKLENKIKNDKYTQYIYDVFDIQEHHIIMNILAPR